MSQRPPASPRLSPEDQKLEERLKNLHYFQMAHLGGAKGSTSDLQGRFQQLTQNDQPKVSEAELLERFAKLTGKLVSDVVENQRSTAPLPVLPSRSPEQEVQDALASASDIAAIERADSLERQRRQNDVTNRLQTLGVRVPNEADNAAEDLVGEDDADIDSLLMTIYTKSASASDPSSQPVSRKEVSSLLTEAKIALKQVSQPGDKSKDSAGDVDSDDEDVKAIIAAAKDEALLDDDDEAPA